MMDLIANSQDLLQMIDLMMEYLLNIDHYFVIVMIVMMIVFKMIEIIDYLDFALDFKNHHYLAN
jgi:hypothetical protein